MLLTAVKGTNIIQLSGQIIDEDDPKSGPGGAHMKFAGELRVICSKRFSNLS